jgi:hypothetical protein
MICITLLHVGYAGICRRMPGSPPRALDVGPAPPVCRTDAGCPRVLLVAVMIVAIWTAGGRRDHAGRRGQREPRSGQGRAGFRTTSGQLAGTTTTGQCA